MPALEGKVKLPGVGEVSKKTALVGGAATGVVIFIAYRKHSAATAAAASTAATTTDQTDPAGNTGQIDPATGYVYGSPEDQSGLGNTAGAFNSQNGGGGIDPNTGVPYVYETGSGTGGTSGGGTGTLTVAEWIANAENDLNAPALAEIAPKVFAGLPVSKDDKNVFLEAVAVEGQPPGGYPTPIKLTDTAGHPGTTGSTEVTVPVTIGESANSAIAKIESEGLTVTTNPIRSPTHEYESAGSSPEGGRKVTKGSHVTLNVKEILNVKVKK